jgi:hypothetical protein
VKTGVVIMMEEEEEEEEGEGGGGGQFHLTLSRYSANIFRCCRASSLRVTSFTIPGGALVRIMKSDVEIRSPG